jgi:hypothetical protein
MIQKTLKLLILSLFISGSAIAEMTIEPGVFFTAAGNYDGKIYQDGGSLLGEPAGTLSGLFGSLKVTFDNGNWDLGIEYMKGLNLQIEDADTGDTGDLDIDIMGVVIGYRFTDNFSSWIGLGFTGETKDEDSTFENNVAMKFGLGYKVLDWLRVNAEYIEYSTEIAESGLAGTTYFDMVLVGVSFPL